MGRPLHPPAFARGRGERRRRPRARGRRLQRQLLVSTRGRNRGPAPRNFRRAARGRPTLVAGAEHRPGAPAHPPRFRGRARVRRARAHGAAAGLRATSRGGAGGGARCGLAAARGFGDGGGGGSQGPRRRAVPLGLLSREGIRLLPDRLAFRGQSGARAGGAPQLRGRIRSPRHAGNETVHRASARGSFPLPPDRSRRRRALARAHHSGRLRALRSRSCAGARHRAAALRAARRPARGALREVGVQLDGGRAPLRPRGSPQPRMISIVIPVYNEARIVRDAAAELCRKLDDLRWEYELILAENGSRDGTLQLLEKLPATLPRVRWLHEQKPNYGRALKRGILEARGEVVICDEIDLCDVDFYLRALPLLEQGADLVVGSKAMKGANDSRPWIRRAATRVINLLLRIATGFQGTDTHGLKAFKRERLTDVARACVVDRDLFASEFVIRAQRMGRDVREIPIALHEKRPPSTALLRRGARGGHWLVKLGWAGRVPDRGKRPQRESPKR